MRLYEQAPCGLLSTHGNGLIVEANQTFCRWLGYDAAELVRKQHVQGLLTVGCKIFHQTHWMPLLQMQGSVAEVQLEFVHRDTHVIPALVNAIRRTDEEGAVFDDLAVFPATDRRKYERELLGARKRAEELLVREREAQAALHDLSRARAQEAEQRAVLAEQLVGIVSHDLRTPLNAVLLGASLLARTLPTANARMVNRIISAANRASRLISDLLDFTQARVGGGLPIARQSVDPHGLVDETLEELRLGSPGRRIEHVCIGSGEFPLDPDRLAQVVTNLTSNALSYGAPDQPVTVTTSVAGDALQLEVHNFGEPIPAALLPHLFEPLRRGDQQIQSGSRSVGLGLYIVQQIARAHGGEVTVRSASPEGTRFTVRLPAG